jgi:TonB-linked SusC/RagA family outer membrane protein
MKRLYNLARPLAPLAVVLVAHSAFGQVQTISGKVLAADRNEPLPGVTVVVKGTTIGTGTAADGSFSLSVPNGTGTLVVSFVGYITKELPITGTTPITVTLSQDVKALQEVVVVGYGTQRKSDVTGSLSSVSAEQIQQVPTTNLTQALQGRAAGVDISGGSFRPGETPSIRIRGNRSVQASNEPLYVVDGIPLAEGTGINDFNPQDIASVEVLKDASATAIYGSRGANGVVLITTNRGKEGKFSINYNTFMGFDRPLVKANVLNGPQFAEYRREANRTSGSYPTLFPNPVNDFAIFGTDPYTWESIADGYEWVDRANRLVAMRPTTEEERAQYGVNEIPVYDNNKVRTTNWADMALRTGTTQSHQISASGGSEKIKASLSIGYLKQKGVDLTQDFSRYTARMTLDYKVNNIISVGGSTNASLGIQNFGTDYYGKMAGQLPISVPYDVDGKYIFLPGADVNIVNPILDPDLVFNERRFTRFFGSFYGEAKLLEGLRFRINVGPDFRNSRTGEFQAGRSSNRQGGTSFGRNDQNQNFTYVVENLLFYDKQLGTDHSLGITLLQSVQQDRSERLFVTASNLPYDSQRWYNLGSTNNSIPESFGNAFSKRRLQSWMGRVNYSFKDRYVLTASGRYDGSSVLAPKNKWAFFPSFALAWKLQEEAFLKDVSSLTELKLRAGYGAVGQSSVAPYLTGGTLGQTGYVWDETPAYGYGATALRNSNLTWEKTSTINLGIDYGFFQNRVSGSLELYRAHTYDLLLPRAIPTASGFNNVLQNIGDTRNTGIEASLTTQNIESEKFRWGTTFVFTKNKEEFVSLSSGAQDDIGNRWFIGQPLNVYYDYKFQGIWQTDELDQATKYGQKPGQIKVVDQNNDGRINAADLTILGSTVPKWSGSVNNTFSYAGFDLSFLVYARVGQLTNLNFRPGLGGRYQANDVNYWTATNPSNDYPRPDKSADIALYGDALRYKVASFVKVRSISLNYTFPKVLVEKLRGNSLSAYVNVVNPFLFTKIKGFDPEITDPITATRDPLTGVSRGVDNSSISTKSLVVGLRVGF